MDSVLESLGSIDYLRWLWVQKLGSELYGANGGLGQTKWGVTSTHLDNYEQIFKISPSLNW